MYVGVKGSRREKYHLLLTSSNFEKNILLKFIRIAHQQAVASPQILGYEVLLSSVDILRPGLPNSPKSPKSP